MTLTKELLIQLVDVRLWKSGCKLPPKLKYPRSFTIPCRIGDHYFERALLDLRAGVN